MLILIAFIAVVTFIRAFDNSEPGMAAAEPMTETVVNK
jgi:hypothetical protein